MTHDSFCSTLKDETTKKGNEEVSYNLKECDEGN